MRAKSRFRKSRHLASARTQQVMTRVHLTHNPRCLEVMQSTSAEHTPAVEIQTHRSPPARAPYVRRSFPRISTKARSLRRSKETRHATPRLLCARLAIDGGLEREHIRSA